MCWQPEGKSLNNLLSHSLETLHSRFRDMVRKVPYAANIIDTIVSNFVGRGIKPQSKAKDAEFRKKKFKSYGSIGPMKQILTEFVILNMRI
jgi:capsid protein